MNYMIEKNISLKDKNWFETGGNAEYFAKPKCENDYFEIVKFANKNNLKVTLLGSGANVLINDDGINGLVINPSGNEIKIGNENYEDIFLIVDSGVSIETLIIFCLENNIIGLEEFSGIPGTVGGAVYINLHYFKFLIGSFVEKAKVLNLEKNEIFDVENSWFEFGYNKSKLLSKKYCVINVTFKLKKCSEIESSYAKGRSVEIIRHRMQRYPYKGTCGSFFRNFNEDEINFKIGDKKILNSAFYLDQAGVKMLSIGGASVSYKHANMIVNDGTATTKNILDLAKKMQEVVFKKFSILLKPECEFLGFEKNYIF